MPLIFIHHHKSKFVCTLYSGGRNLYTHIFVFRKDIATRHFRIILCVITELMNHHKIGKLAIFEILWSQKWFLFEITQNNVSNFPSKSNNFCKRISLSRKGRSYFISYFFWEVPQLIAWPLATIDFFVENRHNRLVS